MEWQAYTNKKLYYARLQLDAWERSESFEQEAYREAFLVHAFQAYASMLAEVLLPYGVKLSKLVSLEEARRLIREREGIAEFEQLKQLQQSDSWLIRLQHAYGQLSYLEDDTPSTSGRINAVMIASSGEPTGRVKTPEGARNILSSLKCLVKHFREFNQEL